MSKIGYEKVEDGIAIYKPTKSRFYWARVRIDGHPGINEVRKSLKTENRNEAIYYAQKLAIETGIKIENNIDLQIGKPNVEKLANKAVKTIENKKPFKPTYTGYIRILNNDIIPFFKEEKTKIDELDRFELERYFNNKGLKSQTFINMTKTCFKYIYEEGLKEKAIKERDIPKFPRIEKTGEVEKRDFFNEEELANVLFNFSEFIYQSRKRISKENRFIMMCYCFYLIGSGSRPGEECLIKWNDLEIKKHGNVEILMCKISKGKTKNGGGREIVLDKDAIEALNLMIGYKKDGLNYVFHDENIGTPYFKLPIMYSSKRNVFEELDDLQKNNGNDYVFERNNDKKVPEMPKPFEIYINWLREKNKLKNKNHTLYSFRHTYITTKLLSSEENWKAEEIAAQCGNSLQMIWNFYLHLQTLDKAFNFKYYKELRRELEAGG